MAVWGVLSTALHLEEPRLHPELAELAHSGTETAGWLRSSSFSYKDANTIMEPTLGALLIPEHLPKSPFQTPKTLGVKVSIIPGLFTPQQACTVIYV